MREIISLNENWKFTKTPSPLPQTLEAQWETVNLPHTWNALDGQDGGNDYYRGECWYAKSLKKGDLPKGSRYYLEFLGANSSAQVYLNGKCLARHDGGYSTWRVEITQALEEENLLAVSVDNSPNDRVYPQVADFTFYGGLYRNVNLIAVPESHFCLDYYGAPGIQVTPKVEPGSDSTAVTVNTWVTNPTPEQTVRVTILDGEGNSLCSGEGTAVQLTLDHPHLWNGRPDPYLYTARAELWQGDTLLDAVSAPFGCRSFRIDPEQGFILNGKPYPLHGVSRHQDRLGIGNALLPEHHKEDMELICELGCTTIRLAHYQHDPYFYDLCDQRGLIIWAEIPYISRHMPTGRENTLSQMRELIVQNYNHPSIVVWGLSNEITMNGVDDPDLLENHRLLNDLCHSLDSTRLTTMAVLSMCPMDAKYLEIPDVLSYNHYFGWYGGNTGMNGPWFDKFHAKHPDKPIGCSEYGCEALNWHTSKPMQGDYTEEYQAYYHEELIQQLFSRPYIWSTHVWNMFDFGADARAEGGENGQNHKGLVTFDRKYKKDSFYAYKAWLSDEPFVHLCGKRYVNRVEDVTRVTVYSNQKTVELFANGKSLGVQEAENHFFRFDVPNAGQTHLVAKSGSLTDESDLCKVEQFDESYRLKEKGAILNWFDITEKEGYLSLNSQVSDILATLRGKALVLQFFGKLMKSRKQDSGEQQGMGFQLNSSMMEMLGGFTLIRMINMSGMLNIQVTKEELLEMNRKLNQIRKKEK